MRVSDTRFSTADTKNSGVGPVKTDRFESTPLLLASAAALRTADPALRTEVLLLTLRTAVSAP
jgi:hypothetical protein